MAPEVEAARTARQAADALARRNEAALTGEQASLQAVRQSLAELESRHAELQSSVAASEEEIFRTLGDRAPAEVVEVWIEKQIASLARSRKRTKEAKAGCDGRKSREPTEEAQRGNGSARGRHHDSGGEESQPETKGSRRCRTKPCDHESDDRMPRRGPGGEIRRRTTLKQRRGGGNRPEPGDDSQEAARLKPKRPWHSKDALQRAEPGTRRLPAPGDDEPPSGGPSQATAAGQERSTVRQDSHVSRGAVANQTTGGEECRRTVRPSRSSRQRSPPKCALRLARKRSRRADARMKQRLERSKELASSWTGGSRSAVYDILRDWERRFPGSPSGVSPSCEGRSAGLMLTQERTRCVHDTKLRVVDNDTR